VTDLCFFLDLDCGHFAKLFLAFSFDVLSEILIPIALRFSACRGLGERFVGLNELHTPLDQTCSSIKQTSTAWPE
jgi:hypothetical protein